MKQTPDGSWFPILVAFFLVGGCGESDRYQRAAEIAEQAAERQAEQNQEMVRLNREVAEGTRRLVQADAVARQEIIGVHQDLQAERAELNKGLTSLEAERKSIARERRTESLLVPAAKSLGVVLVSGLVIGFCWTLLVASRSSEATEAELNELLIQDLTREQPQLLSGPFHQPAIGDGRSKEEA